MRKGSKKQDETLVTELEYKLWKLKQKQAKRKEEEEHAVVPLFSDEDLAKNHLKNIYLDKVPNIQASAKKHADDSDDDFMEKMKEFPKLFGRETDDYIEKRNEEIKSRGIMLDGIRRKIELHRIQNL